MPQNGSLEINWSAIEALATIFAVVMASLAFWQGFKIDRNQREQNRQLHEQQTELSRSIHRQQILLAQRQLFLPLFENMKELRGINPQEPVWVDVINSVNLLELLAVCWEGEMVEPRIILQLYKDEFIRVYESIAKCTRPEGSNEKDGRAYLHDSPTATRLYKYLKHDYVDRSLLGSGS